MAANTFDIAAVVSEFSAEDLDVVGIFSLPFNSIIGQPIVNNIFSALSSVGVALMLVYFFIDLEEVATRQNFNLEMFVKNLAKFIVGLIVILNVGPLLNWVNEFTTAVMSDLSIASVFKMTPVVENAKGVATNVVRYASEAEWYNRMGLTVLVAIFSFLVKFVLWGVAIKRAIELGVYYAFSPIIYADIFSSGLSGVVKKLKPFIALYLQLPYVLILIALGNALIIRAGMPATTSSVILLTLMILKSVMSGISHSKDELERFLES